MPCLSHAPQSRPFLSAQSFQSLCLILIFHRTSQRCRWEFLSSRYHLDFYKFRWLLGFYRLVDIVDSWQCSSLSLLFRVEKIIITVETFFFYLLHGILWLVFWQATFAALMVVSCPWESSLLWWLWCSPWLCGTGWLSGKVWRTSENGTFPGASVENVVIVFPFLFGKEALFPRHDILGVLQEADILELL